jgi:hypothetical protein
MRFFRVLGLLVLVGSTSITTGASTAYAWTRTVVHSARATVDLKRDASLDVLLRLDVEVQAGWLHEVEIVDLGAGMELDRNRPPYFRSEDGEVYRPDAELSDEGQIRLRFARRDAPRRGDYKLFIRYRTPADVSALEVEGEKRARVVWSLPAWETGLHGVSVEIRAPRGASVPDEMRDPPPGMSFELKEGPQRTILRWQRIHLPRMTAWPLAVELSPDAIALPPRQAETPPAAGFRPLQPDDDRPLAWAVGVLALLAWLKRRLIEARFGRSTLWLPIGWPATFVASATVVLLVQWLAPAQPGWGLPLVLLVLRRPTRFAADIASRRFTPARPAMLRSGQSSSLLDATTGTGATVLLACGIVMFALGQPLGVLLIAPIFLFETRLHVPPDAAEATGVLADFLAALRLPAEAPSMSFRWECADDAMPRVRIHMPRTRTGTLSVSFAVTTRSLGFAHQRDVALMIETRAQSDADDVMRRRLPSTLERREADGRVFRIAEWRPEALELLRVLGSVRPKPVKSSRGTWLLKEISEPRREAA